MTSRPSLPLITVPEECSLPSFLASHAGAFASTREFRAFYDDLDRAEGERVNRLWSVVQALEAEDRTLAAVHAEYLVRAMPDEDDSHGAMAVRTFAEALLARIRVADSSAGNLYLDARPPGAQLRAFELLRLRTPLIPFAYAAGNRAILDVAADARDITLVDVGIGRGGQVRALLRNPSARRMLRSIHVVGIEPDSASETQTGALEIAEQNVRSAATEVGIPLTFHAIPSRAEDLTLAQLNAAGLQGTVIASSAFCLHHLPPRAEGASCRPHVMRLLREAGAEAFVLVEPDSNHHVDSLPLRFLYAFRHYRTVSRSLHNLLSPPDASLVWQEFFAPEVTNVIGHDGEKRTERHEESPSWLHHLQQAGWQPQDVAGLLPAAAAPSGFTLESRGTTFSLAFQGVSVLTVMRAAPPGPR